MFQNLFEIQNGNLVIRDSNTLAGFVSVDLHSSNRSSFADDTIGKIGSLPSKEVLIRFNSEPRRPAHCNQVIIWRFAAPKSPACAD